MSRADEIADGLIAKLEMAANFGDVRNDIRAALRDYAKEQANADTRRLDWLERHVIGGYMKGMLTQFKGDGSIRSAIDNAQEK